MVSGRIAKAYTPMDSRILTALDEREDLLDSAKLTAYRLVDGEGDWLPGLTIDVLDGVWLVSTTGKPLPDGFTEGLPASCRSVYWKQLDQHDKKEPVWVCGDVVDTPFVIIENGVRYEVSLKAGYSQGLFLDQRGNRRRVRERVRDGDRVLNCFSYTCGFSVVAALGGAIATSLDLSGPYLEWGKRNFALNDLAAEDHYFCKGDTLHWLRRFAKQGRRFNGIVLDPPTFSRSDSGVFRANKDYGNLVMLACQATEAEGWLLCCCNERRMYLDSFMESVREGVAKAGRRCSAMDAYDMPEDFTGEEYLKSVWVDLQD